MVNDILLNHGLERLEFKPFTIVITQKEHLVNSMCPKIFQTKCFKKTIKRMGTK